MTWLDECIDELPQDLLDKYFKTTLEVKKAGIPEKLKSGKPLTTREQLLWQNWKNLNKTLKTLCYMAKERKKLTSSPP